MGCIVRCCPIADKMVRCRERSDVPLASFAAKKKRTNYFAVSDEPLYGNRCREQALHHINDESEGHHREASRILNVANRTKNTTFSVHNTLAGPHTR
jgi:hypothetical protein